MAGKKSARRPPHGKDGVIHPYHCPLGLDPLNYCDRQTRVHALGDDRYLRCRKIEPRCGWVGKNVPISERYTPALVAAPARENARENESQP